MSVVKKLTKVGAKNLSQKLDNLKNVDREQIIKDIEHARSLGDLKENAEYHAAKESQRLLEKRIAHLESLLSSVQVIDVDQITDTTVVSFGLTVTLFNLENDRVVIYQIVGADESDLKAAKISDESPIAQALLGKSLGDQVDITIPSGTISYEIQKIEKIA
jgi:transcription elongation factor GreA